MIRYLLLFTVTFFVSVKTQAQCEFASSSKNIGTTVVYINGVWTNRAMIQRTITKIKSLNKSNEIDPSGVEYGFVYNWEHGVSNDLLEFATQKFDSAFLSAYQFFNEYEAFIKLVDLGISLFLPNHIGIRDLIVEAKQKYMETISDRERDTTALENCYKHVLDNNKKVYAISHSQGGMFANEAYSRVFSSPNRNKEDFAIYQIASPAKRLESGSCWNHGKSDYDVIVKLIGEKSNISDFPVAYDPGWHGVLETYLNPENSGIYNRVISDIVKYSPINCGADRLSGDIQILSEINSYNSLNNVRTIGVKDDVYYLNASYYDVSNGQITRNKLILINAITGALIKVIDVPQNIFGLKLRLDGKIVGIQNVVRNDTSTIDLFEVNPETSSFRSIRQIAIPANYGFYISAQTIDLVDDPEINAQVYYFVANDSATGTNKFIAINSKTGVVVNIKTIDKVPYQLSMNSENKLIAFGYEDPTNIVFGIDKLTGTTSVLARKTIQGVYPDFITMDNLSNNYYVTGTEGIYPNNKNNMYVFHSVSGSFKYQVQLLKNPLFAPEVNSKGDVVGIDLRSAEFPLRFARYKKKSDPKVKIKPLQFDIN